jgi:hypothetical protein
MEKEAEAAKERERAEAETVATRAAEEEVRQAQEKARAVVDATGKVSEVADVDVKMGEAMGAGAVAGTSQGKVSPFEFFAHTPLLIVSLLQEKEVVGAPAPALPTCLWCWNGGWEWPQCEGEAGWSCRRFMAAKKKCTRAGEDIVWGRWPKAPMMMASGPGKRPQMPTLVEQSSDEVVEVVQLPAGKRAARKSAWVVADQSVHFEVAEVDDPADDELGEAICQLGRRVEGVAREAMAVGQALGCIGAVIGKYDLRKE